MDTAVNVAESSAANEAVISETITETPVTEAAPEFGDELLGIWDKHNPPRENGRFVAKNPTESAPDAPVNTEVADQTAETAPEQVTPAIDAPISWSAEMKAKLSSLPPEHADVIKYAVQRDKEQGDAISRAGQQIKAFEPVGKVIEQFAHVFQKNGLQPHDGIARMLAVNEMLEQNPRAAIAEIARAYGVNLSGETADANPDNPRIAELEAQLSKISSHLTAQQRQQLEAENNALAREIADFAKDKPHFESVRKVMAGLMQSGAAETMQEAYDKAIYADPTIRQSLAAEEQTKAEAKRKADEAERVKAAKKAAGVNVKSSPGQTTSTRTMEDDLKAIWQKNHGSN